MGQNRFDPVTYADYSSTHHLDTATREEVFTSRHIDQGLDPTKIALRESCDSEANPNSTPVILALDVTGSMGFLAEKIAKDGLPKLMGGIYERKPITDPHLMFMGIGDAYTDAAPLQVSQYEAEAIPLIEQLRKLWLEGNGGGNNYESYNLPWHFAAHKTKIDSFIKRQQKGYLFTIGDELPPTPLAHAQLRRILGGDGQHPTHHSLEKELEDAQRMYKVFHVVAEEGSFCRGQVDRVRDAWTKLLGPNVINLRNNAYLPEIVIATLKIANGTDMEEVIRESEVPDELRYAFSNTVQQ